MKFSGRFRQVCSVLLAFSSGYLHAKDGPLSPEESLKTFQLEPGLKIELVAAEPTVVDPVAIAFDELGRMYVAEDIGYPTGPGKGNPPAGRIALLEDKDRDGVFETRTTFAEGLTFPNGVMPWNGGVYVTCAPEIFYLKDTDGDGKADLKQVVFSGFLATSTTQLRISHPTLNIDNWVYVNSGLMSARVTAKDCGKEPLVINRQDFRFQPNSCNNEEFSGTGQFGGTFDKFGRRFICSNRNHNQHVVMQGRYLRRNPNLSPTGFVEDIPEHGAACKVYALSHNITTAASHTGYFTSACGLMVYNGTALPKAYGGNSFTCEPAGNLVHRDILTPSGATFSARRAYATNEFIASPDNWFRPVNLATGPDGALYLCDMYRKTIEHPDYLPEATRKVTDFESGKDMGRIYRITAANHTTKMPRLKFATASARQLCQELEHANQWHRMTAHRLLLERKSAEAVPHLRKLAGRAKAPETRIHALYLLEAQQALDEAGLLVALKDRYAPVREIAIQLAESRLTSSPSLVKAVVAMAEDQDARVRFQCALTLGEINDPRIVPALVKIATRDAEDRWVRAAVMSSLANFPGEFLNQLAPEVSRLTLSDSPALNSLLPLFSDLGRSLTTNSAAIAETIQTATSRKDGAWQIALLAGFADQLRTKSNGSNFIEETSLKSPKAANRIAALMQQALETARNNEEPMQRRMVAIGLLSHDSANGTALQTLLDPQQPNEVQIAAVRALAQLPDTEPAMALAKREHWNGYTQSVKDAVLAAMLSKPALLNGLLSAMESGAIDRNSINPEKRNQLMRHKDAEISRRAKALFENLKPSDRMAVYEELKPVLSLKANSANGRKIFGQSCASCHVFSGEGHLVGPDLTGIRSQPADVVLLHIIVPEFEIMPIYTQYNVETRDGMSYSGILTSETPSSITLKQALGLSQTIQRSNIASMTSSTLSLMPQELEKTMSKQDLADLVAFLKGE